MAEKCEWARRVIVAVGAVFGAVGVMSAAGASHGEASRNLGAISTIALAHGPALLALGLASRGRLFLVAAALLAVGTAVFAGDLAMREWQGTGLFTGAAPLGGFGMIAGWAMVAVAAIFSRNSAS